MSGAEPAKNLYETLSAEYLEKDKEIRRVEDFLVALEGLSEKDRDKILIALKQKGLTTIEQLDAELLSAGRDVITELLKWEEPKTPRKDIVEGQMAKTKITPKDVAVILQQHNNNSNPITKAALRALASLDSEQQVEALRIAGIKHPQQFNPNDVRQMRALQSATVTALTNLKMGKGRDGREVYTPTGGKNR